MFLDLHMVTNPAVWAGNTVKAVFGKEDLVIPPNDIRIMVPQNEPTEMRGGIILSKQMLF